MKNTLLKIILFATIISTAFVFTACGSSDSSDDSTEATTTTSVEESQLASQAEELNKDEANFYGKWEATTENAKNLYGFLEVTVNEDGTVIMDMADEHLEGTWEKIDGGIHFKNELFEGDLFYGKKCKMVIREIEEDENIQVTLTKVE